ncbi:MAG: hypothetical protein ABUL62_01075 [Myxococcales bacterium]
MSSDSDGRAGAASGGARAQTEGGGAALVPGGSAPTVGGAASSPELERELADPTLNRRLVAGPFALVGNLRDSCTNAEAETGDRWCAISRTLTSTSSELWVVNFTRAIAADAPIACDGSRPDCLRLSSDLWVDYQFWGDSQPVVQRFEGDTLIFHSGPATKRDPYDGGIWAWRPGWQKAAKLTEHGVFCFANPRSSSVACISNALIEKDFNDLLAPPYYREFDLLVGVLTDADQAQLPLAAHVMHAPDDQSFRLRFSPNGQYLAYSSVAALGEPETVRIIHVPEAGVAAASTILSSASEWEIAHDGQSIYYLSDYQRSSGIVGTGTLRMADFPSGQGSVELTPLVRSFELIGTFDLSFRAEDRGLVAVAGVPDVSLAPLVMLEPRVPERAFQLQRGATSVNVSPDLRHTLYFTPIKDNPVVVIAHNDGAATCQLTADSKAESYYAEFTDSAAWVAWIERKRTGTRSEQGFLARPGDCGSRFQFGDHVLDYWLAGDDFVLFKGSDASSSTFWLEYTKLAGASGKPQILREQPDINTQIIQTAEGTWFVYSASSQPERPDQGLFAYGPLTP